MIISKKQIAQLLRYAEDFRCLIIERHLSSVYSNQINEFLNEIKDQQSEELKEIE